MPCSLLGLGSNLGDRRAALQGAMRELDRLPSTKLLARSGMIETPAIGGPAGQPAFLNAAALVATALTPQQLLRCAQQIEQAAGRERGEHWSARTLDVDLLTHSSGRISTTDLELPHPRMAYRRFVLEPAAEAAPWLLHATSNWTIGRLLNHLDHSPNLVAVAACRGELSQAVIAGVGSALRLPSAAIHRAGAGLASSPGYAPAIAPWLPEARLYQRPRLILGIREDNCPPDFEARWGGRRPENAPPGDLGVDPATGDPEGAWRKILSLPTTGPIAWIDGSDTSSAVAAATAVVQSVWPGLA